MAPTDSDLVARVLADDDRGAFAEVVRRHQSPVRALLRRLACGDAALADDLAQEAFLRAYRGLASFRGDARLGTWLHRIAYRTFLDEALRRHADIGTELPDEAAPIAPQGADLRMDLERAMRFLSPAERTAIALAFGRDLSHEEVAAVLDCPVGTVKTHIARGKDRLRRRLVAWRGASVEAER